MSTVKAKNSIIKYKDGKQMIRISFDIDKKQGETFKKLIIISGQSMASILRPHVIAYIHDNKYKDIT